MTRRNLWHAGPSVPLQPKSPLTGPWVKWDWRDWDGTTGTGSGGLPNSGLGGSDFDLDVGFNTSGGEYGYYARQNGGAWTSSPSVSWDQVGGDPCDAPFTIMVAIDDFRDSNSSVYGAYFEFDILFRRTSPSPTIFYALAECNGSVNSVDQFSGGGVGSYFEVSGTDPFFNWFPDGAPGDGDGIRNRLHVLTFDIVHGGTTYWRGPSNPTPIGVSTMADSGTDQEFFVTRNEPNACSLVNLDISTMQHFFYLEGSRRVGAITVPVDESELNVCRGAALFRGEPTAADIAYWDNYWFP